MLCMDGAILIGILSHCFVPLESSNHNSELCKNVHLSPVKQSILSFLIKNRSDGAILWQE